MTVIALTSAKGAPGVTTTALALTLLWPRPVLLAECDPAGDSSLLAGYMGGSVEHTRGLLGLLAAQRRGELADAFWSQTLPLAPDPRVHEPRAAGAVAAARAVRRRPGSRPARPVGAAGRPAGRAERRGSGRPRRRRAARRRRRAHPAA